MDNWYIVDDALLIHRCEVRNSVMHFQIYDSHFDPYCRGCETHLPEPLVTTVKILRKTNKSNIRWDGYFYITPSSEWRNE